MKSNLWLGLLFKFLSLIFTAMITLRFATTHLVMSNSAQIFVMSAGGALLSLFLVMWGGPQVFIVRSKWRWYFLRAFITVVAMNAWAYSAKKLGASEQTLISYTIPLSTMIIAALIGMEKMVTACLIAVVACIIILLVNFQIRTDLRGFDVAVGFFAAICYGFYDIVCKKQSSSEHFLTQAFYVFGISSIMAAPFAINEVIDSSSSDIINALYFSPIRLGAIVTLFLSYRFASINILMPMGYLRLPIMAVMVYFSVGKTPNVSTIVSGLLIVLINIIVLAYMGYKNPKKI